MAVPSLVAKRDAHGASASSRARDRNRGIAAILCHAVGRGAKLQGAAAVVVS